MILGRFIQKMENFLTKTIRHKKIDEYDFLLYDFFSNEIFDVSRMQILLF